MNASWVLLGLGIALEVAGTVCMKRSDGFRDLRAAGLMYLFYGLSLTALTFAFKRIDVGVGYAVWSGAGLALVVAIGMIWFREPATTLRVVFLLIIFAGLLGLRLVAAPAGAGFAPVGVPPAPSTRSHPPGDPPVVVGGAREPG
jgi:small multidrug resistance pump